jgi:hypothetical protein
MEKNAGTSARSVKNMNEKCILKTLRGRLDRTLILFELVLSVIFISVDHLTGNMYLRGVGVGLIIAWVTSALAPHSRAKGYLKAAQEK